ncbi:MAG TPA: gliding motility-associated C-terminal domain-containing protein, partial [Roseivirga sp.]
LEIFITSKATANVEILIYRNNSTRAITVNPGVTHQEVISFEANNPFAARGSDNLEQKAIKITSDENISVYAFNNRQRSADATVVLPFNTLGKEYYVSAYWEDGPNDGIGTANSPSEFLIVATQNGTEIEITPTVETRSGKAAGVPFKINMSEGQVYQVQADDDLSGTLVKASSGQDDCKNFAVFGGNMWGRVTMGENCGTVNDPQFPGGYAADQLFEQMYPTSTWGKNYVAIPYELRAKQGIRVMAKEDGTEVRVGLDTYTLNAGEYETFVTDQVVAITANNPIQVAQFSLTMSCDTRTTSGTGDPFMIMLNPNEQQLNEINFNALAATELNNYYLTVITDSDQTGNLTLNGDQVSLASFTQVPEAPEYSYASISILKGLDYNLKSSGGFVAYIYAFGFLESFGYVAGASLENLNLEVQGNDEFIEIIQDQACLNAEIAFSVDFDTPAGASPRFNTFDWDFGNGDMAQGQNVTYTYTRPGEYNITLVASDGLGSCGTSETVVKTITVEETLVNPIVGASSVCPDVNGIEYTISGGAGNTYEWLIEGGTITSSNLGEKIMVNWGAANSNASLKVLAKNAIGCRIDTIVYPVVINKRLEPVAPYTEGPVSEDGQKAEVCFEERSRVRYFVNATNGSNYRWQIEGGSFTSDTNPNGTEVFVDWGNSSSGKIWYIEANDFIDDCEGVSEVLEVTIYSQISPSASITDILCFGEATGAIDLSITGGKPGDYQVSWDNGMTGESLAGLSAGNYVAMVTDALGCTVEQTFTIAQPEELVIANIAVFPVRCFQEDNGSADLTIMGGVKFDNGNYQFIWESEGIETITNQHVNDNLSAGTYNVKVIDANGCEAVSSFVIEEPPLLEVDIESIINEPICPQASNGMAFIDAKGGTPDYQFYWSNKPTVDDPNASDLSRGNYEVRVVDANGCETSYEIEVVERFPKIFIPNAFSPNGDGNNDTFKPVTDCQLNYYMQVFNKWGTIVFSSEDINVGWDGTFQGEMVQAGEYSYVVFYSGTLNEVSFEETYRGSFSLIR